MTPSSFAWMTFPLSTRTDRKAPGRTVSDFKPLSHVHIWSGPIILTSVSLARRARGLSAVHLSLHQLSVSGRVRGEPGKEAAAQT